MLFKVFPSSFSIKAALGNLKISDDSLPSDHPYFWVCDMRNPGGSSFVEVQFGKCYLAIRFAIRLIRVITCFLKKKIAIRLIRVR